VLTVGLCYSCYGMNGAEVYLAWRKNSERKLARS
jgi:hypothetical protein